MDDNQRELTKLKAQIEMVAVAMGLPHGTDWPDMLVTKACSMREEIARLHERLAGRC